MDEVTNAVVKARTLERLKVPKRIKTNHLLDTCNVRSKEFLNEVLPILQASYKIPDSSTEIEIKEAFFIQSSKLQDDYLKRKNEMKQMVLQPGTSMDMKEYFGFYPVPDFRSVLSIAEKGISIQSYKPSRLGCRESGVSLCMNADLIRSPLESDMNIWAGWIVICKYVRGRVNYVMESDEPLDPTVEFDCHISSKYSTLNFDNHGNVFDAFFSSQVYLFEFNNDFDIVSRPRQILPTTAVSYVLSKNRLSLIQKHRLTFNQNKRSVQSKKSTTSNGGTTKKQVTKNVATPQSTFDSPTQAPSDNVNTENSVVASSPSSNLSPAEETLRLELVKQSNREVLTHAVRTQLGQLRGRGDQQSQFLSVGTTVLTVKDMPEYRFSVELRSYGRRFTVHPLLCQPSLCIQQLVSVETLSKYLKTGMSGATSYTTSTVIDHRTPKVLPRSEVEQKMHADRLRAWNSQQLKRAKMEPTAADVSDNPPTTTTITTVKTCEETVEEDSTPPLPLWAHYLRAVCVDSAYSRGAMARFCCLLAQNDMGVIVNLQVATDTLCVMFPDSNYARSLGIPEAPPLEVNYLHVVLVSRDALVEATSEPEDMQFYVKELQTYHHQLTLLAHAQQQLPGPSASRDIVDPYFRNDISVECVKEFANAQNAIQQKSLFQILRGITEPLVYPTTCLAPAPPPPPLTCSASSNPATVSHETVQEIATPSSPPPQTLSQSSTLPSGVPVIQTTVCDDIREHQAPPIVVDLTLDDSNPDVENNPILTTPMSPEACEPSPVVVVPLPIRLEAVPTPELEAAPTECPPPQLPQVVLSIVEDNMTTLPETLPSPTESSKVLSVVDVNDEDAEYVVKRLLRHNPAYSSASSSSSTSSSPSHGSPTNVAQIIATVQDDLQASAIALSELQTSNADTVEVSSVVYAAEPVPEAIPSENEVATVVTPPDDWQYSMELVDRALDQEVTLYIISSEYSIPALSRQPLLPTPVESHLFPVEAHPLPGSSIYLPQHQPQPQPLFIPGLVPNNTAYLAPSTLTVNLEQALKREVEKGTSSSSRNRKCHESRRSRSRSRSKSRSSRSQGGRYSSTYSSSSEVSSSRYRVSRRRSRSRSPSRSRSRNRYSRPQNEYYSRQPYRGYYEASYSSVSPRRHYYSTSSRRARSSSRSTSADSTASRNRSESRSRFSQERREIEKAKKMAGRLASKMNRRNKKERNVEQRMHMDDVGEASTMTSSSATSFKEVQRLLTNEARDVVDYSDV